MRQRGAGSRAIKTDFDFTFGLATIAPVAAILPEPTSGPPAKRPRLSQGSSLDRKPVLPEAEQPPPETAEPTATKLLKKATKARRRFPVDDEKAEITDQSVEDSFVATAKSKKPRAKRKPEGPIEVAAEDEMVKTSASSRPRRRAAADAETKVQNDLAEEAAPIDRKRRADEPVKVGRKGKKNVRVVAARTEVITCEMRDDLPLMPAHDDVMEPKKAPAKKTRDTKTETASQARSKAAVSRPIEVPGILDEPKAAAPLAAKRKPRAKGRVLEHVVEHDHKAFEADELSVAEAEPVKSSDKRRPVATKVPKAANGRKRKVVDAVREESEPTALEYRQQRQSNIEPSAFAGTEAKPPSNREPLAEADGNVMRLSASPAKMGKGASGTGGIIQKPTTKRRGAAVEKQTTSVGRLKRRKVVAEADELSEDASAEGTKATVVKHELVEGDAGVTQKSDSVASTQNTEVANRRREDDADEVATSSKAKKATKKPKQHQGHTGTTKYDHPSGHEDASRKTEHGTEPNKATKQALASQKLPKQIYKPSQEQEEDVDWLFAPHQSRTKQPKPLSSGVRNKSIAARDRNGCGDLPDVDLDDLVANIASLAPRRVKA
ncbi:hypothetical protein Tdes44962_MAKER04079 [Teratosphaeria destructans]|uniref:Uncharacterized protein n=1 Tax=Teratosphaeria destructans TaxID=418781 RepID=A0A9W7W0C5_9PEZI|nr:hypothetical protein Tdes44962_MAKER04079 [Teratosphaeria destructans]